jgi:hypothetical protein
MQKEVRQGDIHSPLLFVMAVDLLQRVVNKTYNMNLLKHPLSKDYEQDLPILQYLRYRHFVVPINIDGDRA